VVLYFENVDAAKLAAFGELHTPSVSDLFVANFPEVQHEYQHVLIRREFWENRAIWVIPAVFGALLILAALFGK